MKTMFQEIYNLATDTELGTDEILNQIQSLAKHGMQNNIIQIKAWEVRALLGCDGENVWLDENEKPQTFETYQAAKQALNKFVEDTRKAFEGGYMSEPYDLNDFEIVRRA